MFFAIVIVIVCDTHTVADLPLSISRLASAVEMADGGSSCSFIYSADCSDFLSAAGKVSGELTAACVFNE